MPDDGLSFEEAGDLARETVDKAERERAEISVEWVTVMGVSFDAGLVPMAIVQFAAVGDAQAQTMTIPCITGIAPKVGERVAVLWCPPAGCYVFGTQELLVPPSARMSKACSGGSQTVAAGDTVQVEFCCYEFTDGIVAASSGFGIETPGEYLIVGSIDFRVFTTVALLSAPVVGMVVVSGTSSIPFQTDPDTVKVWMNAGTIKIATVVQLPSGAVVQFWLTNGAGESVSVTVDTHVEIVWQGPLIPWTPCPGHGG